MRTLNLSGFQPGDNLTLSVSQGALTAGPINVPAWGAPNTGGTITINADRMALQVAPDSVRFSVDLSASTFETPGEVSGEFYNAQYHDLIYLWDFDDAASGDWTAPEKVLPGWKNRNIAKGPWVAHVYTQPGTYNPSVLVIEPSSGKTATASVEVIVANPDTVYAGTNTICVNPVGDSDFSGEPSGAARVNIDDFYSTDSEWTSRLGGSPKRWLFKRGASFDMNVVLTSNVTNGVYFGSYGPSSVKPNLKNIGEGATTKNQLWAEGFGANTPTVPAPIYLDGLHFTGTFDPTTEWSNTIWYSGFTATAVHLRSSLDMVVSNCDFTGHGQGSFVVEPTLDGAANHIHMDHCTVNEFGGQYAVFMGPSENPASSFAVTGCRLAQIPTAFATDITGLAGSRSPIRAEHYQYNHVRGCDLFHTDGSQPCLKLVNIPRLEGAITNVHSCSFEGGASAVNVGGSSTEVGKGLERSNIQNSIIDGIIYVVTWHGAQMVNTYCTGLTVRNCLAIWPNAKRASSGMIGPTACFGFIQLSPTGSYSTTVGAQPVRIYNNTFLFERTPTENNNHVPVVIRDSTSGGFTNILGSNNVVHMPNLTVPQIDFAPLSTTALWTPRAIGRRCPGDQSPSTTLGANVVNGGTVSVAYWIDETGHQLVQADFASTFHKGGAFVSGSQKTEVAGTCDLSYDATEIVVTNTSGATWVSGSSFSIFVDYGPDAPFRTTYATPSGAVKDTRPLPGSVALGAALSGDVSYMDILGTTRTAPADKGAWEVA